MNITRRTFLGTTTPAALGAGLSVARSWKTVRAAERGANERIRMGAIGTANRGGQIIEAALAHPEVEFVALCDVQASAMDKWAAALPGQVDRYSDYRKLIERNDIDAVLIATPDHWHALQCVDACHAGKDVYVEKPLSITIAEGRRMIEVARETRRIVQVGLHRRSSPLFFKAEEAVKTGELGKVSVGTAYRISNMFPDGIGKCQPCDPPPDLDWDMWLGPSKWRPYNPDYVHFNFRWMLEWGGGNIRDRGAHVFSVVSWFLDLDNTGPARITATGTPPAFGIYDCPPQFEVVYEFKEPELTIVWSQPAKPASDAAFGEVFYGDKDKAVFNGGDGGCGAEDRVKNYVPPAGGVKVLDRPAIGVLLLKVRSLSCGALMHQGFFWPRH